MRHLLVAASVALLLGCQQSPVPGPEKVPLGSLTVQLRAQGDRLAARGDYAGAAVKYRAAVNQASGDSGLWFSLGVALSHLDRRDETIEAFRRVVDLGRPDSQEVRVARGWLVRAGVLTEAVSFTPSEASSDASDATPQFQGPTGSLQGKTEWRGLGPKNSISVKIVLSGDDASTQGFDFSRRVKLGQPFTFEKVPTGAYRLVARAGGWQLWEERVTVSADGQTVLNLSPTNSPVSPDEFPVKAPYKSEKLRRFEPRVPGQWEPPPAGTR